MPFLAYVREREPEEPDRDRRPWEPNWRIWRWLLPAAVVAFAATRLDGPWQALLVLLVFGLCCRAALDAVPDGDGLRDWRQ